MAGHVALFQLHAADAVLEAPLPRDSRNIVLENGRSFLPRVFKEENFATRTFTALRLYGLYRQGPEEWRGRVRERYVPWRKTGRVHNNDKTPRNLFSQISHPALRRRTAKYDFFLKRYFAYMLLLYPYSH